MANNAKRRQQQRGTAVEPIIPQQIFKRDNWICHLCGMAVDPSLSHPDPMSASLDHITPLSDGGTHTEDNVACSHLRCNLSKGNRFEVAI
ncbi:HNH endonuclease [Mycobacterium sp. NPDC003449]